MTEYELDLDPVDPDDETDYASAAAEDDYYFDLQALINSGTAWRLEGSIGRAAMAAIEDGRCMLGTMGHRDYWGNYIPSRFEVKPGTKGSQEYVIAAQVES